MTTVPSATLSLTSEEDEVVIPKGITAIRYTLTEDGQEITRKIAVESTDTVKYYKEEDGYYTLAVYDNTGAIKSKGYTLHSDNIPNIDITYSAGINNGFTESDEYVEFVPTTKVTVMIPSNNSPYEETIVIPPYMASIKYTLYDPSNNSVASCGVLDLEPSAESQSITVAYTWRVYNKSLQLTMHMNDGGTRYFGLAYNVEFTYGTSIN